jgi:hypothetical protein
MVPITGNPASSAVVEPYERSLRLQVGGEKPVEGKPDETGQAGMQMSIQCEPKSLMLSGAKLLPV